MPLSSAVLLVVAPIKCEETVVDCNDVLRVLGSVEVLSIGLFDLDVSVFRVSVMFKTNIYIYGFSFMSSLCVKTYFENLVYL